MQALAGGGPVGIMTSWNEKPPAVALVASVSGMVTGIQAPTESGTFIVCPFADRTDAAAAFVPSKSGGPSRNTWKLNVLPWTLAGVPSPHG
jgi:hypothetical protein